MKTATKVIRMIDDLDWYMHKNFTAKEIYDAIIEEGKKKKFFDETTGLVCTILEDVRWEAENK